jgi:nicotinamide-nucleotide amidase
MLPPEILARAAPLLQSFRARGWRLATAESCTGGLICAAFTSVAGSSDVVDRGFVTYSNEAKTQMLGVPAALIAAHGAVSDAVAASMASGAMAHSRADVAVSVTGVAGPGGGTADKPVGLVWFGCAVRGIGVRTTAHIFQGDRAAVRAASVAQAFDLFEGEASKQSVLF